MSEILTVDEGTDIAAEISQSYLLLPKVLEQVPTSHAHWRTLEDLPPDLAALTDLPWDKFKHSAEEFLSAQGIESEVNGTVGKDSRVQGSLVIWPLPMQTIYRSGALWHPENTPRLFKEVDFEADIDFIGGELYPNSSFRGYFKFEIGTTRVEGDQSSAYVIGYPVKDHPRTRVALLTNGVGYKERLKTELSKLPINTSYEDLVFTRPGSETLIAFRSALSSRRALRTLF